MLRPLWYHLGEVKLNCFPEIISMSKKTVEGLSLFHCFSKALVRKDEPS